MKVEYKKDLRHNYMVITQEDQQDIEPYSIKILEHQSMDGTLPVSMKRMDDKLLFYYDITAKQSLTTLLDRATLKADELKNLYISILQILAAAYDYLLSEDNFLLSPEYIYVDISTVKPYLCYLPGYKTNIDQQMTGFMEYLMNRIDYNDKEAVILVYRLYAVCRETGFIYDQLMDVLRAQNESSSYEINKQKNAFTIKAVKNIKAEKNSFGETGSSILKKIAYNNETYSRVSNQAYSALNTENKAARLQDEEITQSRRGINRKEGFLNKVSGVGDQDISGLQGIDVQDQDRAIHKRIAGNKPAAGPLDKTGVVSWRNTIGSNIISCNTERKGKKVGEITGVILDKLRIRAGTKKADNSIDKVVKVKSKVWTKDGINDKPEERVGTWGIDIHSLLSRFQSMERREPQTIHRASRKENKEFDIPVMMERVEGEAEQLYYPLRIYLSCLGCILFGLFMVMAALKCKILYNPYSNQMDYSKLFALVLVIICMEGYLLKKLFDKRNMVTRMVKTYEYIDPRQLDEKPSIIFRENNIADNEDISLEGKELNSTEGNYYNTLGLAKDKTESLQQGSSCDNQRSMKLTNINRDENNNLLLENNDLFQIEEGLSDTFYVEEEINPTCILNATDIQKEGILLKANNNRYSDIIITAFPFIIGKLKKNVDYCLESDAISRFHAKISKEGGIYYLTDLNSTNGTFINKEALHSYEKRELKEGDEVTFANISFILMKL